MKEFNLKLQEQFNKMCALGKLFRVALTGQQMWDIYLSAFSTEDDPIFRDPNSTVHKCNLCSNFIRRYGNIVAVDAAYNTISLFDFTIEGEYANVVNTLSAAIRNSKIENVFFETYSELNSLPYESCTRTSEHYRLGIDKNVKRYTKEEAEKYGVVKPNEIRTFNHMYMTVPAAFVDKGNKSVESIMGDYRQAKEVFQKGMEVISLDTLHLVMDLINQNSLLDGATHAYKIEQIIPLKQAYDNISASQRDNWCWVNSYKLPFAKFKNELIGVLCTELAEGEELNKACASWNKRVDPINYMKATAPITKRQIEEAKKFVEENGYVESFDRRFATIDDIKVTEIKHINVGDGKLKNVSIFDGVKSTSTRHKRTEFDKVEEVSIEKFMKDILPSCTAIEAFITNQLEGNFVSLTTANIPDSKPIMKWDNNYSWTFNGNLAGKSQIKEAVKSAGGNVEGVLRFSIMWGDGDHDHSDLDAWCTQPGGERIGFSSFCKNNGHGFSRYGGQLDIDDRGGSSTIKVENIYFTSTDKLKSGDYEFVIRQFAGNGSKGFKAEIEFDGQIYNYAQTGAVRGTVAVATVTYKNGVFSIKHILPETEGVSTSKVLYGLDSYQFHKVNLVCLSPNHWGSNNVGNKHYLFMLDGCKSPVPIRSFHIENILPELAAHRKVLEVLGTTNMISPTDKQLSGIGFNATVRDELVVRLSGNFKRVIKIKF